MFVDLFQTSCEKFLKKYLYNNQPLSGKISMFCFETTRIIDQILEKANIKDN